jgi:hypothetical protein
MKHLVTKSSLQCPLAWSMDLITFQLIPSRNYEIFKIYFMFKVYFTEGIILKTTIVISKNINVNFNQLNVHTWYKRVKNIGFFVIFLKIFIHQATDIVYVFYSKPKGMYIIKFMNVMIFTAYCI